MTAISDRQKVMYAIIASVFVHLAIGLILALWTGINEVERALPPLTQLTVTIMPAKPVPAAKPVTAAARTPPPPRPANMPKPVLDSDGLTRSAKAPAKALFQSDANMVAGSQLPATGDAALPSQAGPRRKFTDFTDQAAAFGKGQAPAPPRVQPKPAQAAQTAQSMPEQTPSAVTQVEHTPTPVPTPIPTPKPAPTVAADTLALGKPTPKPAAALPSPVAELAKLTTPPSLRGHADIAPVHPPTPPEPAAPSQPSTPGMQRELEKTQVDGGITKPGAPGVDAVETPFGRYHRKLSNLIGSRWKLYLQEHPKDVGDVTILVRLDTNGKVAGTRVVANHSMDDLADLSTRAIMESDLPPVPDDLAPMLRDGKLEISFNFNVYDASNDSPGR